MAYGYIEHPYLQLLSWLMVAVRIDDPVDAIAVHGAGGIVGILSVPIFMEVMIKESFRKQIMHAAVVKGALLFVLM